MNSPVIPEKQIRGYTAISILRIVLWLLPAFLLLGCLRLSMSLNLDFLLLLLPGAAITVSIGYLDRRLYLHREVLLATEYKVETIQWVIGFTLLQIIISPGFASLFLILISQALRLLGF